jgi:DNA-binding response OmpR family regulator
LANLHCSARPLLSFLKEALIDLVVMDLGLAGKMDGVLTARSIREWGPVPLLFISGYDDEQTHTRLQEFEKSVYLTKPVRPNLLLQKIQQLLLD